ncbi:MAG: nickel-dependent lactate racemase [Chloroflexota bacterium]
MTSPESQGDLEVVSLRNGDEMASFGIAPDRLLDHLKPVVVAALQDPGAAVREALDRPVGTAPLEELVRGSQKVLIVTDDLTRPTPTWLLLPDILARIEQAGVRDDSVTILIATGTHRPMTDAELRSKLGPAAVDRYRIENHRYDALDQLVELPETAGGVPVTVNRLVAEADFIIGVGNIVPHRYCGWAGGAKIIQPGVSGEATTAATHLMITKDPLAKLGVVENSIRHGIEAVADRVGLSFIVNTILNGDADVVAVVAGDFRQAFRHGVEIARTVFGAPYGAQVDVVVASSHPSDINLWQAGKAFYVGDLIVREGGVIILVSPCYEGVGEHGSFTSLLRHDYATIDRLVATHQVEDRISAAAALAVALVRARCDIWLVTSGITPADAEEMGMRHFTDLQTAIDAALVAYPDGQVTTIDNATEVLPIATLSEASHA